MFISLKVQPQDKIFYLHIAFFMSSLIAFYLQVLRRNPLANSEEERLERAGAARGRCGTQRS